MASLGGIGSSGKAVGKQPSKDGSGSDNEVDDKVTTGRGSDVSGGGGRGKGGDSAKSSSNDTNGNK